MAMYALTAALVAAFLGYRTYRHTGFFSSAILIRAYAWFSSSYFSVFYNVTEDIYDDLAKVFGLKVKHPQYIEALRAFSDVARTEFAKDLRQDIGIAGEYFVGRTPLMLAPIVLFLPVWQFYILGLVLGYLIPVGYKTIELRLNGTYVPLIAMNIAKLAYRYRYNKELDDNTKARA